VLLYDPNGAALGPPRPLDPRLVAVVALAALFLVLAVGFSIPGVRRRLRAGRSPHERDEWIM